MALDSTPGHSHEVANLAIAQFQNAKQNQNALFLLWQGGKRIGNKLIVEVQITAVGRKYKFFFLFLFLCFSLGFSSVPGCYTPYPGMHMQFLSGPAVSVQGAWFATPYWGFGGRMSCTNLRVKVNGVAQNDNLECASMYAGPYFSHPFSMRWLVGAKLLGGCEIYKPCRTDFRRLERRAGFSFGTGLSTTYLAAQNLGVRFSTDYDVAPPVVRSSRERLHKLTFSMEVCAVF